MLRALSAIAVCLGVIVLLLYMQTFEPEALDSLIMKMDAFGLTQASREEHARQDRIMRLEQDAYGTPIGSLEKTALLNHTVFINASAQMVEYALGSPKTSLKAKNSTRMLYVYFLANDKWPTVFEFRCVKNNNECDAGNHGEINKGLYALVKAYKESKIDVDNLKRQENSALPPAVPKAR